MSGAVVKGLADLSDQGVSKILGETPFTQEDAITADFYEKLFGVEGTPTFVELTQEKIDEITASLSPEAAQAIKDSTVTGNIVFKKVGEGGFIPIDISATLESVKLGKYDSLAEAFNAENAAHTIYGVGLQATEGIMDLVLDVGMFAAGGWIPKVLGTGINIAEAAGGAAMEIEHRVVEQLQCEKYLNSD